MSFDPEFDGEPYKKHGQRQRRPAAMLFAFLAAAIVLGFFVLSIRVLRSEPAEPAMVTVMAPTSAVVNAPTVPPVPAPLTYHLIVNRETGQCLDVPYGNSEPRTPVEQFPVNGGGNQLWSLDPVAGDGVRIINKHSGKCLDIPHGTQELHVAVEQFPINGGSNQGWRLEPVSDGWYCIVSQQTGLCLEVPCESQERRTAIEQAPPGESTYQHWRLIAVR